MSKPDVDMKYRNHYKCTQCGTEWTDDWDSMCDDRCPNCGTSMSPHHSDELCMECGREITTFMHNCPNSSDMPEIEGCPHCDDVCPFCKE